LSPLRLGTRGSALALAQARWVAERLGDTEIVEITTAGDLRRGVGDKSRWTGALERALLDGEIDLAVHSAKDVPGKLATGTEIAAVPPREDPRDVLVGAPLGAGARVGTSSLRRRAQLLAVRPDLEVVELRGNVDTRLRKLADGEVDALVLAAAGLARLGRDDVAATPLAGDVFVPAPGQGFLAVQARADGSGLGGADDQLTRTPSPNEAEVGRRLVGVDDPAARALLAVERDLVARLDASCHTPVGAHARATSDGISLRAFLGLPDGSEWLIDELAGGADLAARVAERLLAAGADDLLRRAEAKA
jgi:hydroxymethylbilane synthase